MHHLQLLTSQILMKVASRLHYLASLLCRAHWQGLQQCVPHSTGSTGGDHNV